MNDKPMTKPTVQSATVERQVRPSYPADPRAIPTTYSNLVGVVTGPHDLILDFSLIQPQALAQPGGEAAPVLHRIILPKQVAANMAGLIVNSLREQQSTPEGMAQESPQ